MDLPKYNGAPITYLDPRQTATHSYFAPAPFAAEDLGVSGNANRRFFHGPGLNNWDVSLHKATKIAERYSVEFRAEFFNVLNHAQFSNPAGNFTSKSFGRVTSARDPRIGQLGLKLHF
jgi:hypothetical protein